MCSRWTKKEADGLADLRRILKDELEKRPQYPDVVGDRRLLRFLRCKHHNVKQTAKMVSAFLKWRDDHKVDDIRNEILYGGIDTPEKFPNGRKIIELAPQIVVHSKIQDKKGQPLVVEQYSFKPAEMFAHVTAKDYLLFLVYAAEYRALVMEQMSHERELEYLAQHPNAEDWTEGYGVVLLTFCIRDLKGVGMSHITGGGKQIIDGALKIDLPNYPEYLGNSHMINVPWIFTSIWFLIKQLLDEVMVARIHLSGANYMDTLLKDISRECIPKAQGGLLDVENETYEFDLSHTGPFYSPDCKLAVQHATAATTRAPSSEGSVKGGGSGDNVHSGEGGGSDAVDALAAAVEAVALTATESNEPHGTRTASPVTGPAECTAEG